LKTWYIYTSLFLVPTSPPFVTLALHPWFVLFLFPIWFSLELYASILSYGRRSSPSVQAHRVSVHFLFPHQAPFFAHCVSPCFLGISPFWPLLFHTFMSFTCPFRLYLNRSAQTASCPPFARSFRQRRFLGYTLSSFFQLFHLELSTPGLPSLPPCR